MYWDEMDLARSAVSMGERVVIAGRAHVAHGTGSRVQPNVPSNYRAYYLVRNRILTAKAWLRSPFGWLDLADRTADELAHGGARILIVNPPQHSSRGT